MGKLKQWPLSREGAVVVGRHFAKESGTLEAQAIAAAEAWFDAKKKKDSLGEGALREYLKSRFV